MRYIRVYFNLSALRIKHETGIGAFTTSAFHWLSHESITAEKKTDIIGAQFKRRCMHLFCTVGLQKHSCICVYLCTMRIASSRGPGVSFHRDKQTEREREKENRKCTGPHNLWMLTGIALPVGLKTSARNTATAKALICKLPLSAPEHYPLLLFFYTIICVYVYLSLVLYLHSYSSPFPTLSFLFLAPLTLVHFFVPRISHYFSP